MATLYNLDVEFPNELLAEVGRLALAFSQLEHVMKLTIKRLLGRGFKEGMDVATKLYTFPNMCRHASELYAQRVQNQEQEAWFAKLMNSVLGASEDRNRIVHSLWGEDPSGEIKSLYKFSSNDMDLREIATASENIKNLTRILNLATAELAFPVVPIVDTVATALGTSEAPIIASGGSATRI